MRTYGRVNQVNGVGGQWVEVSTDESGDNSNVYLTTVCQTLKLALGESPFNANYGIPAVQSVMMQIFPDLYASQTQQQYAPYFASLIIQGVPASNPPVYSVTAVCYSGAILTAQVAT